MDVSRDRAETPLDGLLTVDCGNTTLDCMFHDDGERRRFDGRSPDVSTLTAFLGQRRVRRCVAVTVVHDGLDQLAALLARDSVPLLLVGRDLACPLRLDYDTPETLGPDRWIGALAAWQRHGRAVVVDCGSATTVNLVEGDGTFRGGAIAPGLRAFAKGLAAATPALPPPDFEAAPAMPPRSTQSAVDTGVLLGWCGLVERLVAATLAVARGPAQVVVTGGNAEHLLRHTRLLPVHEPGLVHAGLRALAGGLP
jgi:type III pantothenate kinase